MKNHKLTDFEHRVYDAGMVLQKRLRCEFNVCYDEATEKLIIFTDEKEGEIFTIGEDDVDDKRWFDKLAAYMERNARYCE